MNAITDQDAQTAMDCLNTLFKAAMAAQPSGLVPEAAKVQAEKINADGQALADFITKTVAPSVSSNLSEPVEVMEDPPKQAVKKSK